MGLYIVSCKVFDLLVLSRRHISLKLSSVGFQLLHIRFRCVSQNTGFVHADPSYYIADYGSVKWSSVMFNLLYIRFAFTEYWLCSPIPSGEVELGDV